jgi:hypothetical protein
MGEFGGASGRCAHLGREVLGDVQDFHAMVEGIAKDARCGMGIDVPVTCGRGLDPRRIAGVTSIQTGDWIRVPSLWPGVWRVYRVLSGFREDRWSLDEELKLAGRCLLFCYRLVNDSWRRSFFHQCCDTSLARALSPDDRKKVEDLLSSDMKVARAFEKYQAAAKPIDLVANLGFGEFKDSELEVFSSYVRQVAG